MKNYLKIIALAMVIIPCTIALTACGHRKNNSGNTIIEPLSLGVSIEHSQDKLDASASKHDPIFETVYDMSIFEKMYITFDCRIIIDEQETNLIALYNMGTEKWEVIKMIKVNNNDFYIDISFRLCELNPINDEPYGAIGLSIDSRIIAPTNFPNNVIAIPETWPLDYVATIDNIVFKGI
jgi:hypothetical protein